MPDFYQGNELWELTLVDPDNRKPVDYDIRNRHLEALDTMLQGQGAARVCDELMRYDCGRTHQAVDDVESARPAQESHASI